MHQGIERMCGKMDERCVETSMRGCIREECVKRRVC